ncbi:MAG: maleylpyruvate isomerase N-terminal domain-containing protein [Sediminibacterium sp.]|nr:maleylpyruvate isomerase N-terminal domain-containing protein [Sediminibacterium sp.]MBX9780278.1 maleylpyruvate isomerase N-terminal domain-containing protein [Chitinophagaceae bacterium]
MDKKIPIDTIDLFPALDHLLIELLKSLSPAEWNRNTIAKKWTIKDIAAHMLDTNMRTISYMRDQYTYAANTDIQNHQQLVNYINDLNASWVLAFKRVSPAIIIELLQGSNKIYFETISKLDPWEDAIYPVSWVGETKSKNWFYIAREYTERYIHQQQIRDALGKDELYAPDLFHPFINTLMVALPYTYRNTLALEGTTVSVQVSSAGGGCWTIQKKRRGWEFIQPMPSADAVVDMRPDTAWKLFSKGITPKEALSDVTIVGNKDLAIVSLQMVSVIA